MIRIFNIACFFVIVSLVAAVYHIRYSAEVEAREVATRLSAKSRRRRICVKPLPNGEPERPAPSASAGVALPTLVATRSASGNASRRLNAHPDSGQIVTQQERAQ